MSQAERAGMMKRAIHELVVIGALMWAAATTSAEQVTVKSPGGKLEVEVAVDGGRKLTWTVRRGGIVVLGPGALGLTVDEQELGTGVSLGEVRRRTIEERYPTWGNHAVAVNHCNDGVVELTSGGGKKFEVVLRAYDDGAAVRMSVPMEGTHAIADEATTWVLPAGSMGWWAKYEWGYEDTFAWGELETMPQNVALAPPVTFRTPHGLYVAVTEADNQGFPDMGMEREGAALRAVFPASMKGWKHEGAITTPWRLAIVTSNLNDLVNSDLVTNLCPPAPKELADAAWIKPGRVMWHWWAIGAPKLSDQKAWVDATRTMGWEYYLVDEGWRGWKAAGKDQWQCLKEVIDYGKQQGVKTLVWVDSKEMRTAQTRRAYLEKVAALGAAGIKIDFIPRCTPEITRWYEGALKDTADLHLICNFHGAVKPTGRRRTWPHELTREGVRGLEFHMTRYKRVQAPEHDQIVPFTRLLLGPADYTPTTFNPKELGNYSKAHMLAQSVVMTSPLLCFGGGYTEFVGSEAEDFLRHVPSVWDETILLDGSEIGEVAGFARRRGEEWFIGVLNGKQAKTLPVPLRFLGKGEWEADVYADETGKDILRKKRRVTAQDRLEIPMRAQGGLVVWVRRAGGT
jgi:alpha-glucosidase